MAAVSRGAHGRADGEPCEDEVNAAIAKFKAEKEAKKKTT
jgi:hypothetical protein